MRILILFISVFLSLPSFAHWQLANDTSHFTLVTTKAINVTEVHSFKQLRGELSSNGNISFAIDLTSIDTNVVIRNQRMQKYLFNTDVFPKATFSSNINYQQIENLALGKLLNLNLKGQISLHGIKQDVTAAVQVIKLHNNELLVSSTTPIIIRAEAFNLSDGIKKLASLANLPSISNAVPISFSLHFIK